MLDLNRSGRVLGNLLDLVFPLAQQIFPLRPLLQTLKFPLYYLVDDDVGHERCFGGYLGTAMRTGVVLLVSHMVRAMAKRTPTAPSSYA